ncbi:MAG TPA: hypothetical protein VG408_07165 [Actinomycetota bacterium]|nr:hypothetical protein [Actinomycetota bacterium]
MTTMSVDKTTVRVGGVASKAWGIYRTNTNTMLLLAAAMVVPAYVIIALLLGFAAPEGFFETTETELRSQSFDKGWTGGAFVTFGGAAFVGAIVAIIATLLATGACFKVIQEVYAGRTAHWRVSLAAARGRLGPLMWLALISGVLLLLAFLALVIPGIYLWVAWSVAVPVLMTEDLRGIKALSRSRGLIKGTWWPAFGVLLVGAVVSIAVSMVLGLIFQTGADEPSLGEGLTMGTLQEMVTQIIVLPFVASLAGVLYFELRRIKETGEGLPPGGVTPPPAAPPSA